jgi:hypothetical protein
LSIHRALVVAALAVIGVIFDERLVKIPKIKHCPIGSLLEIVFQGLVLGL